MEQQWIQITAARKAALKEFDVHEDIIESVFTQARPIAKKDPVSPQITLLRSDFSALKQDVIINVPESKVRDPFVSGRFIDIDKQWLQTQCRNLPLYPKAPEGWTTGIDKNKESLKEISFILDVRAELSKLSDAELEKKPVVFSVKEQKYQANDVGRFSENRKDAAIYLSKNEIKNLISQKQAHMEAIIQKNKALYQSGDWIDRSAAFEVLGSHTDKFYRDALKWYEQNKDTNNVGVHLTFGSSRNSVKVYVAKEQICQLKTKENGAVPLCLHKDVIRKIMDLFQQKQQTNQR